MLTHAMTAYARWLSPLLDRLELLLWSENTTIDTSTAAFYVFKPFPSSLKSSQYQDWGRLQSRTLTPFENGDRYVYIGREGVSIWACPSKFNGIPETAAQKPLPDGLHQVKGKVNIYQQQWNNGIMHSCRLLAATRVVDKTVDLTTSEQQSVGWAVNRHIDAWLGKPITWFAAIMFVLFTIFIWQLGKFVSYSFQEKSIVTQTENLQAKVGDKLELQNEYQRQQNIIELLSTWQTENGYLPQTLASVAKIVMKYDAWQVENIEWQGKRLVLLLQFNSADISSLVGELESSNLFSDVAIRPHNKENAWTLEVVQR